MTWAEFRIRLHGFKRDIKRKDMSLRELAWITYISPHLDPKKMKKSKDAFWPIEKKNPVSDKAIEMMKAATLEYLKQKKAKDGSV